ncbi:hypothetical protein QNI16_02325 [Cytophagaceae bacterium YF14B1]|uniref:2-dehydro-3-deoxyphosphooctonate aldolase n=1 Tax=Xanthocytophaga flava TaxID=3048013 RepID=A0AAE3QH66_9BACT|nr:hypothetical protein [Xanthocytophaga flavus]MDJ1479302.1 hypothetical protein [Xanthocytophaga flavus]
MMRLLILLVISSFIFFGCKTSSVSLTHTPPALLDSSTFSLTAVSEDSSYGYTAKNAIQTGGGAEGERRYLNALTGPNGETVTYIRLGSCCAFKTPNGIIDNTGLLDKYEVRYEGLSKPVILYLNMYDSGDMKAPVNFGYKK